MDQLFQKEIRSCTNKSKEEVSQRLSFLYFVIKEISINGGTAVDHYCNGLKNEKMKVVWIDDSTIEGKILFNKRLLFNLLSSGYEEMKKALKYYLLDMMKEENYINLSDDYLDKYELDENQKKQLIEHIQGLFPESFLLAPLINSWGAWMCDMNIILDSRLFEESFIENEEDLIIVQAAKVMLVLLHELAHKKKYLHLSDNKISCRTPPKIQQICNNVEGNDKGTTGELLERYCFGGKANFDLVSPHVVKKLFTEPEKESNWKNFVNELLISNTPRDPIIDEPYGKRTYPRIIKSCPQKRMDEHNREMEKILTRTKTKEKN